MKNVNIYLSISTSWYFSLWKKIDEYLKKKISFQSQYKTASFGESGLLFMVFIHQNKTNKEWSFISEKYSIKAKLNKFDWPY